MARTKFSRLRADAVADDSAEDRVAQHRRETLEEIRLHDLRRGESVTQIEIAERLAVTQGAVSKLEHADDVRVSTLRQFLAALGADLELVAVFDNDRRVTIELGHDSAA